MMKNIVALIGLTVGMSALGAVPADLKLPTPEISRAARARCKAVTSSLVPKALHVSAEEAFVEEYERNMKPPAMFESVTLEGLPAEMLKHIEGDEFGEKCPSNFVVKATTDGLSPDLPIDVILGVQSVLHKLGDKFPSAHVDLHPVRPDNEVVDAVLCQLADGQRIVWCGKAGAKSASSASVPAAAIPAIKMYWLENANKKVQPRLRDKRNEFLSNGGRDYDAIWIGDSITHFWERAGNQEAFREKFDNYRIFNAGFGGDKTQNLLWNLRYAGFLDGVKTRLVSMMIGTNNMWSDTPEDIAAGICACLEVVREKQPEATVLLHAILPREVAHKRGERNFRRKASNVDEIMPKIAKVNELIRPLADGQKVIFVDLTAAFTDAEGLPDITLLGDGTHPNAAGYRVWADAVLPFYGGSKSCRIGDAEIGFRIGLVGSDGSSSDVTAEEMRSFVCRQEGAVRHLVWKGHSVCGDAFTVSADLKVADDTVEYAGFRYEGNVSGRTVSSVVFPECRVPRTDETRLLRPFCTGVVFQPKWTVPPDDTEIFKDTRLSYGFIAALNGSGYSYYLDRRDEARFYAARYEFVNVGGRKEVALRFRHDVPLSEANSRTYRLSYGGVFTRFRGDWYEAAMIYKNWVLTQPHYRKALARDRGRLRDVGLWMWSRGRSKDILPDVERVRRETGVPIALDWYWWHHNPYDTQYPFFWPPRENLDEFKTAVKRLREQGVWVQPYTNGTAWDCDDPSWTEQGGRDGAVIRNGDIIAHEWNKFAHHRLARMCGEAPRFQKIMEDLAGHIAESGFNSLYLDQINCLGFGTCLNPRHRHEQGGGDHMIRNYRAFVDRIRAAHPGMQLSTEEFHEAYLDTFDSVISVYSGYERYGFKAPTAFVPVAPAIFHRCQTMYGSFATVGGLLPWDEFWPASERWPTEAELPWEKLYPDHFAIELCRGVTWGLQPMVHNFKAAYADDPRFADDCRFLFETARFYHANRDLLFDGEMLNPGRMDCPTQKVDFLKRKTFTPCGQQKTVTEPALPCVFHSVWRAPDGTVAAVLVNWSRKDVVCRLATPDISFERTVPARSWLRVDDATNPTPWVSAAEREFVRRRTERIDTQSGTPESDAVRFYSSTNRNEYVAFNYDETKAGVLGVDYRLEDPLVFFDGRKVENADDWQTRRKEILSFYERNVYGRFPPRPDAMVFALVAEKPTADGLSIERRYRQWFRADKSGPAIDWLLVLPRAAKKPCPVILHLNYHGNDKIAAGRTNHFDLPLGEIGARGYAFMSACYKEITSDGDGKDGRVYDGVCELFGPRDFARKDNSGSLIVWAWGLCRGLDLAEKIVELDARRSVVIGSSRLGKAALLAAAYDERIAVCVPNQTGAVGVQLMKRDYGETLKGQRLALPHWYCANVWQYADNPKSQPFDQHLLLSCVAPRALLLECYHKKWFDPKGEWLAAQAAAPVWKFLTGRTLDDIQPTAYDEKSVTPPFGYVRRTGTHGLAPEDWKWALDFADKALLRHRGAL